MRNKDNDIDRSSGDSPTDKAQVLDEVSTSSFWDRQKALETPGGNQPRNASFVLAEEHPVRDINRGPVIIHEDPDRLRATRVDQADQVVARYDRATDLEKAELRPRSGKKSQEKDKP